MYVSGEEGWCGVYCVVNVFECVVLMSLYCWFVDVFANSSAMDLFDVVANDALMYV